MFWITSMRSLGPGSSAINSLRPALVKASQATCQTQTMHQPRGPDPVEECRVMDAAEEKDDELEDHGIVESDGQAGKDEEDHAYGEDEMLGPDVDPEPVEHLARLDGLS